MQQTHFFINNCARFLPTRILPILSAVLLMALGGCSLGDAEQAQCRCGPDTSTVLFPECADALISAQREDASNPFATQLPDCPSGRQLFLLEPTRPEAVLTNLTSIFQAPPESRSPEQYMDQLTENFNFVPDEEDIQRHPEVYDISRDTLWTAQQERDFARAILDPERIQSARFTRWYQSAIDERIPSEDGLSETFIFPYEVEFIEIVREEGADEESNNTIGIKGFMEIDMVTPTVENPVWTIAEWRDLRDRASAKFSWGELRALFAR